MIPTSSQSDDLRQQPLADPAPPGRDGAQARPHARRGPSTRPPPSAIRCGGQSSKEGLKKGISCRVRRRAGWAWLQRSKSLAQIDKSPDRANATKEAFGSTRCKQGGKGRILLRSVLPTCPGRQWLGPFVPNMARPQNNRHHLHFLDNQRSVKSLTHLSRFPSITSGSSTCRQEAKNGTGDSGSFLRWR